MPAQSPRRGAHRAIDYDAMIYDPDRHDPDRHDPQPTSDPLPHADAGAVEIPGPAPYRGPGVPSPDASEPNPFGSNPFRPRSEHPPLQPDTDDEALPTSLDAIRAQQITPHRRRR